MGRSSAPIRHLSARTLAVVLVCRKCSKKLGGGFGPDGSERLAKVLRRRLGAKGKPRKATAAIIEVGCLDVCPKGAVVALRGDRPDDWLLVAPGTPLAEIGHALGLADLTQEITDVLPLPPVR